MNGNPAPAPFNSQFDAALRGLPGFDTFGRRFDAVSNGVANNMKQSLSHSREHVRIQTIVAPDIFESDFFMKRLGRIADGPL